MQFQNVFISDYSYKQLVGEDFVRLKWWHWWNWSIHCSQKIYPEPPKPTVNTNKYEMVIEWTRSTRLNLKGFPDCCIMAVIKTQMIQMLFAFIKVRLNFGKAQGSDECFNTAVPFIVVLFTKVPFIMFFLFFQNDPLIINSNKWKKGPMSHSSGCYNIKLSCQMYVCSGSWKKHPSGAVSTRWVHQIHIV